MRKLLLAFFISLSISSNAQIIIAGVVIDSATQQALPHANLYLAKKMYGTAATAEGKFYLQTDEADSLVISMVGYRTRKIAINKSVLSIKIELSKKENLSSTVQIVGKKRKRKKDDPAEIIMKKVVENKDLNNFKKLEAYESSNYTKIQFNINNVDTNFAHNIFLQPIGFLFKNIDSTTFKKRSVPLLISETSSKYYFKNNPKLENEFVEASHTAGIQNKSIAEFSSNFYLDFNIYDDYIFNFNQNFVSPLASLGTFSYDYILVDTTHTDSNTVYHLYYIPLRSQELTFRGHLWIDSASYAITKATMNMAKDANINYVQSMEMEKTFTRVNGHWMPLKETIYVDANLADKQLGMYGLKQTYFSKYIINQAKENNFFDPTQKVIVSDSAVMQYDHWEEKRPKDFSEKEKQSFNNIDSAMQTKYFNVAKKLFIMTYTGFLPLGKLEWGPYYTTFSWNGVEGNRYKICGRTNIKFSDKWRITGYGAYGTLDRKIKYDIHAQYFFKLSPKRTYLGVDIGNDLQVMNTSPDAFLNDNILASLSRRDSVKYLFVEKYTAYFEKEWMKGTNNRITFGWFDIKPVAPLFFEKPDNTFLSSIKYSSFTLSGRIAYKEKILQENFRRVSLSTRYPIITYSYEVAMKGFLGGDFGFHKAKIKIVDNWYIGNIGYTQFIGEAGKIWGNVPYPLLITHIGNNSYYFDAEAFNLMNLFEFVSDQYVQVMATHHFQGLFLNKIPLLRKLQWRELAFARGVMGSVSAENQKIVSLPVGMSGLNQPYLEAGFGIENIFKVMRIDALWRLTNLNNPKAPHFGITGTFQIKF